MKLKNCFRKPVKVNSAEESTHALFGKQLNEDLGAPSGGEDLNPDKEIIIDDSIDQLLLIFIGLYH